MTNSRRRSQSNGDGALGVFRRIGDQLVDNEAERNAERGRNLNIRTLQHDGVLCPLLEKQTRKILAQMLDILLELNSLLMIEEMQLPVHASQRSDSVGRNLQLRGRFGRGGRLALQRQQAHNQLQAVEESMLKFLRHHV